MSYNSSILIIEDNIETANFIKMFLERDGYYNITLFSDPFCALDFFKSNHKENALIISDVRLPGMNGFDLLSYMKELEPTIKVIFITAFDDDHIKPDLERYDYEIVEIFQKPFSAKNLSKRIKKYFDSNDQIPQQQQQLLQDTKKEVYSYKCGSNHLPVDLNLSNIKENQVNTKTIVHNKVRMIKPKKAVYLLSKTKMGSHFMIIYKDLESLRKFYSFYTKIQIEENNEAVLINPFYETVDSVRQILYEDAFMDVSRYEREESLLIIDAREMYFGGPEFDRSFKEKKTTYVKEIGKEGLSIIYDTGPFHHKGKLDELVKYELSLPVLFMLPLKCFCLFNYQDFERLNNEQKQMLIDHHTTTMMIEE